MAYSKAKLKSSDDKASPCFKLILIGNMSDKFLPTQKVECEMLLNECEFCESDLGD
jgi:hypothetical protein